jgi:hypothetical protein
MILQYANQAYLIDIYILRQGSKLSEVVIQLSQRVELTMMRWRTEGLRSELRQLHVLKRKDPSHFLHEWSRI